MTAIAPSRRRRPYPITSQPRMNPILSRHRTTWVDAALAMRRRAMHCAWLPLTARRRSASKFLLPVAASIVATLINLGLVALMLESSRVPATQQPTHTDVAGVSRVTG